MQRDRFVHQYLERLKLRGNILPDIGTLRRIHKQHLLNIPFENLDIMGNKRIELDANKLWMKIVEQKRGGICYELNGLLFHLLMHIGFDVKYIAAQVLEDGNEFQILKWIRVFPGVYVLLTRKKSRRVQRKMLLF